MAQARPDFYPVLRHLEAPLPGHTTAAAHLSLIKAQLPAKTYHTPKGATSFKKSPVVAPFVMRNFKGNPYNNIPNDNSLAISNDGMIVSVINSTIQVYNTDGKVLQSRSLEAFGDTLHIDAHKFDPRALYDPVADRFIVTYLNGTSAATSMITIAFSQTNDPTGDWNMYALPGNPLSDSSWSDFPMISISNGELFYTINLLTPGGSWQTSFKQTVIWQIDKDQGYKGEAINPKLWSGIRFGNKPIRNLHPVKGGSKPYGPHAYFLSDRNFDLQNDTIFFLKLTGTATDPKTELEIGVLRADLAYGVPPNAAQKHPALELQTNDARILDAFLENNQIVFAANSIDTSNNYAAIYLGHIYDVDGKPSIRAQIFGHDSLEFGYPGLAFTGNQEEFSAVMCMNYSSFYEYPGCGISFYDGKEFSNLKTVREGNSNINILGGAERWGDYMGMQPKYNEPGRCWMSGTFGRDGVSVGTEYGTWIAEIQKYGYNSNEGLVANKDLPASLYPNPSFESTWVTVDFELKTSDMVAIVLFNTQGKVLAQLLHREARAGKNQFSFSTAPLAPGTYILSAHGTTGQLFSRRLMVAPKE
jgi:hypothetical protein